MSKKQLRAQKFAPSKTPKNKAKRLSTDGLNTENAVKLTTEAVSKDQLTGDFGIIWYNITQLKKQMSEKRIVKVYEKLLTDPFSAPEQFPLKNDIEKLLFISLQELRATSLLMVEVLYGEWEVAQFATQIK